MSAPSTSSLSVITTVTSYRCKIWLFYLYFYLNLFEKALTTLLPRPFHLVKNGWSEDKLPTVFQGPFPEEMGGEGGDEADECVGLPPYWQRQQ